jgi:hypothetical protein
MKRLAIRVVKYGALGFIVIVILVAFICPLARGAWTRHLLLSAIGRASHVRVVQHSDPFDHIPRQSPYKEIIFNSVDLSPAQLENLRTALPLALDYSYAVRLLCIFSSHHRIEFIDDKGMNSNVEICFQCGEISFDPRFSQILPRGWDASLRRFLASIRMNPDIGKANQSTDPTLSSGTPAAEQPAHHP